MIILPFESKFYDIIPQPALTHTSKKEQEKIFVSTCLILDPINKP